MARLAQRAAQGVAVGADGGARGGSIEEARELCEVDAGEHRARGSDDVAATAQDVRREVALSPVPDLAHLQLPIDLELVDAARRPDDLDREILAAGIGLRADDVASIRLDAARDALVLDRSRPGGPRRGPGRRCSASRSNDRRRPTAREHDACARIRVILRHRGEASVASCRWRTTTSCSGRSSSSSLG